MSGGQKVDLRNIRSPIVVFCSEGDKRHPAATGAALDPRLLCRRRRDQGLWADDCLHGPQKHRASRHLCVQRRRQEEHAEFSGNIDLIDVLPPGLYEATFEAKDEETASSDLVVGEWVMRCEARTLDDNPRHGRQFARR